MSAEPKPRRAHVKAIANLHRKVQALQEENAGLRRDLERVRADYVYQDGQSNAYRDALEITSKALRRSK